MPKRDIYVKKDENKDYKEFLKETKRQGTSASEIFRRARIEWMITHAPGNYLTRLTSFMEGGHETPAMQEGRIRQLGLEYNLDHSNHGVSWKWIRDQTVDIMGLKGSYLLSKTDSIAQWLHEQGVKVWR